MSKVAENASARIDEAIANAAPFAQEILNKLRKTILSADERLVEDWKWGPAFHLDDNVCGIWGHKKHVNLIFWKGAPMPDPDNIFTDADSPKALRTVKFYNVKEVKVATVKKYVKNAIKVLESGVKVKAQKAEITMPDIFTSALKKQPTLKKHYESLSYYHQKEFAHHIAEAKQDATKLRRLEKVLQMLKDKVGLHDKYKP